jgi:hypothetical protein
MARKKATAEPSPATAGAGDSTTPPPDSPDLAFLNVGGAPDVAGAVADLSDLITDAKDGGTTGGAPLPPPDGAKRGRGRPKGSGKKSEPDPLPDPAILRKRESDLADALAGSLLMLSSMAAHSDAEEFALSETECKTLGDVWAPCLAPYMESMAGALPWAIAAATTAKVLLPRYAKYQDRKRRGETITPPASDVVVTDIQPEGVG